MTLVDSEKATDADPCGELTSTRVPDTDAIDPPTSSSPSTLTGVSDAGAAAADVVVGAVEDSVGGGFVDDPHATADSAVVATSASSPRWVGDAFRMMNPDRSWWFDPSYGI
jgi:hypothetical protein